MNTPAFVNRLLESRFAEKWVRGRSFNERLHLLDKAWATLNKGLDCRERYRLCKRASDLRMHNLAVCPSEAQARAYGFFRLIETIKDVEGDIVECGVGRGVSVASIVYAVSLFRLSKVVYAFDSFAGFPKASPEDVGERVKQSGAVPEGWTDTSPEMVSEILMADRELKESLLRTRDVELRIIPGFFEKTMPDKLPAKIALLHVDADLYESVKVATERALSRLSNGALVVFDEYHEKRWPGPKKAVDELCARHGLQVIFLESARRYGIRIP